MSSIIRLMGLLDILDRHGVSKSPDFLPYFSLRLYSDWSGAILNEVDKEVLTFMTVEDGVEKLENYARQSGINL